MFKMVGICWRVYVYILRQQWQKLGNSPITRPRNNTELVYANNEQYRIAEDGRWHNNADCNMNVVVVVVVVVVFISTVQHQLVSTAINVYNTDIMES